MLAYPVAESFAHAVHRRAVAGLERAGHEVRVLDLYRVGFDPVMSAEDREGYHTPDVNEARVADHLDQLRWAEGLVFVYPTWWYSMPAMLKGWIDRVWVPHATFDLPKGLAPIRGRLHNIRLIGGFSTYGAPWWWTRFVMADPGRRIIMRETALVPSALPNVLARPLSDGQLDPAEPRTPSGPCRGTGGAALAAGELAADKVDHQLQHLLARLVVRRVPDGRQHDGLSRAGHGASDRRHLVRCAIFVGVPLEHEHGAGHPRQLGFDVPGAELR